MRTNVNCSREWNFNSTTQQRVLDTWSVQIFALTRDHDIRDAKARRGRNKTTCGTRERVGRLLVSSYSRPTGGDGTLAMVFGTALPQFTRHERLVVPDVIAL